MAESELFDKIHQHQEFGTLGSIVCNMVDVSDNNFEMDIPVYDKKRNNFLAAIGYFQKTEGLYRVKDEFMPNDLTLIQAYMNLKEATIELHPVDIDKLKHNLAKDYDISSGTIFYKGDVIGFIKTLEPEDQQCYTEIRLNTSKNVNILTEFIDQVYRPD